MFGVSRLNSRSLRIGDPPADTYLPSAHGPSSVRTPCLGRHCWSCCGGAAGRAGAGGQRPWVSPAWLGAQRRSEQSPGEEGYLREVRAGLFSLGSGQGPADRHWLCPAEPLRGEETPATQLGKTSHPFALHSKSSCAPGAASFPRQAAQPPSAFSVPRGSVRSESPSPAISRGCCAERRRRRPCRSCLVIRTRVPGGFRPLAGGPRQWAGACWWAWGAGCRGGSWGCPGRGPNSRAPGAWGSFRGDQSASCALGWGGPRSWM